jgi:hypothetical protein
MNMCTKWIATHVKILTKVKNEDGGGDNIHTWLIQGEAIIKRLQMIDSYPTKHCMQLY